MTLLIVSIVTNVSGGCGWVGRGVAEKVSKLLSNSKWCFSSVVLAGACRDFTRVTAYCASPLSRVVKGTQRER